MSADSENDVLTVCVPDSTRLKNRITRERLDNSTSVGGIAVRTIEIQIDENLVG